MKKPKFHLSPNEVERLVKEERERLRKLRIVQVREQAKASAAVIRNDVRREKARLVNKLAAEVEEQLNAEKDEKVRKLKQKYEGTLRDIGDGHREAQEKGDGYSYAAELEKQSEAHEAAQERFATALVRQRTEDVTRELEQRRHIIARQAALEVERQRAQEIAALPPPPPDISAELEKANNKAVQMMDMKAFATTHYHIPDYQVVRAGPHEQTDAVADGEDTDLKLKQDLLERKRSRHEQIERARIRGNEALEKEMLKHDLGDMLQDLSLLQRHDRRRRQKVLADVPKQVFIPPDHCVQDRREKQMEMERKFDELYMKHYNEQGTVSDLQSVNISEYPDSGSMVDSAETVEPLIPLSRINPALRDLTNVPSDTKPAADKRQEDTVLKQLLTKIRAQKEAPTSARGQQSLDPGPVSGAEIPKAGPSSLSQVTGPDDGRSFVSGDSRPGWQRSEQGDYTTAVSGPMSQAQSTIPASSRSDLDSEAITANDHMIEELMNRIRLIELQKQQLSNQFEAQSGAFRNLLQSVRPLSESSIERRRAGQHSSMFGSDASLKEVDLDYVHGEERKDVDASPGNRILADARMGLHKTTMPVVSGAVSSPDVELTTAMPRLKPVTGILKGQKNLQFELLTSSNLKLSTSSTWIGLFKIR